MRKKTNDGRKAIGTKTYLHSTLPTRRRIALRNAIPAASRPVSGLASGNEFPGGGAFLRKKCSGVCRALTHLPLRGQHRNCLVAKTSQPSHSDHRLPV